MHACLVKFNLSCTIAIDIVSMFLHDNSQLTMYVALYTQANLIMPCDIEMAHYVCVYMKACASVILAE